jgi:hypothetical protein
MRKPVYPLMDKTIFEMWPQGKTSSEIAAVVGCSPDGVKTRINKLREAGHDLARRTVTDLSEASRRAYETALERMGNSDQPVTVFRPTGAAMTAHHYASVADWRAGRVARIGMVPVERKAAGQATYRTRLPFNRVSGWASVVPGPADGAPMDWRALAPPQFSETGSAAAMCAGLA